MAILRGFNRSLNKHGLYLSRLALGDSLAPVFPPLHIKPQTSAATNVAEGDIGWVTADDAPSYYDGAAKQIIPGLARNNTWTGTNVFSTVGGSKRTVKTGAATLTAAESGALCLFNTAAGFLYTLPATAIGLWFDFLVTVTITSVGAKVITPASSFIVGGFFQIPDTAAQIVAQAANGSTHVSWNGNGSTTGGFAGDHFRLTAISATVWAIEGIGLATGTEATPFATS